MPKSALADVSEPVSAVANQPRIGETGAKAGPALAAQMPSVTICPDRFITYAMPTTQQTVKTAHRSSWRLLRYVLAATPAPSLSSGTASTPAISTIEPADRSHSNFALTAETGAPFGATTCKPGHGNVDVTAPSRWPMKPICVRATTRITDPYGARARRISAVESSTGTWAGPGTDRLKCGPLAGSAAAIAAPAGIPMRSS